MTRADFYLIDKPRFRDDPLLLVCELVKKAYAAEQPTLILARSPEQAERARRKALGVRRDELHPAPARRRRGRCDHRRRDRCARRRRPPTGLLVVNLRDECAPGAYERVLEVVAAEPAEREGSRVRWTSTSGAASK